MVLVEIFHSKLVKFLQKYEIIFLDCLQLLSPSSYLGC